MQVLFDEKLKPWISFKQNNVEIYFAGHIFLNNNCYSSFNAINAINNYVLELNTNDELLKFATNLKGQFGLIVKKDSTIIGFVDRIRSFPIFYNSSYISNNINSIIENRIIDYESLVEFKMSGYVLGNKTLFENNFQLKPAEYLIYENNKFNCVKYDSYFSNDNIELSDDNFYSEFNEKINISIEKLINIANNREIILALSAGYDSRLILGKLLEFNYSNISTYTYGTRNLWEVKVARGIVQKLNLKWNFIEFDSNDKYLFNQYVRKDYYYNYSGFSSIPHLADFFSIQKMHSQGLISPKNSIIVNGQTGDFVSGGHINDNIANGSREFIYNYIINKHFSLWENLKTKDNTEYLFNKFDEIINIKSEDSALSKLKKYEYFEAEERQFKYVVNGQRAYDYFGYDWYLPLWSDEMFNFWKRIGYKNKINQNSYISYCKENNPSKVFFQVRESNKASLPFIPRIIWFFVRFMDKIKILDKKKFMKRFLNYYGKYYPYYPQSNYFAFLKDSKFHRHCVSYWVKLFIEENGETNSFNN